MQKRTREREQYGKERNIEIYGNEIILKKNNNKV